jgi:anthranilate synthase/aminodeoxychorismate synthase-like glutamine amidotransferase
MHKNLPPRRDPVNDGLRWVMIDNYDSFTYNLVQLFGALGVPHLTVLRNDDLDLPALLALDPQVLIVSPGPCSPDEAGISLPAIQSLLGRAPILGVCLGHQALVQALGGLIVRAPKPLHGKTSPIHHDNLALHHDLPNPFLATRYHSLLAHEPSLPHDLIPCARSPLGEIMAVRHARVDAYGVQYHPESILTGWGWRVIENFIALARKRWGVSCAGGALGAISGAQDTPRGGAR